MRVLQINAVNGISSTGRTSTEIADYLNERGDEGYIAYSSGITYDKGYQIGSKMDHKIHGLLSRISGKQAYFSRSSTLELINYIRNLNPDIVHLRNLHANYINLEELLSFLANDDIPTVITLHDCWFYTGKCTHYTIDNCYRWLDNCGSCPRLKKDNPSWFFDKTSKMIHDKRTWFLKIPRLGVIGVSDWITSEAEKSFLAKAKIITRIYNWIDSDIFKPTEASEILNELSLEDNFIVLGVASGWSNAKGLDKFISFALEAPQDIKIVLVGRMPKGTNLPSNIIHVDATHDLDKLVKYYSLADVYVHLSEEETFGKTIAEAMSCGTPAIVLNSTACPEVVGESTGIVIEKFTPEELIKAIKAIRDNNTTNYSEQSRRRVVEVFNKQKLIEEHIDLYHKLIK